MNRFNKFNTRFKQILGVANDYEVAAKLKIPSSSFSTMKSSNNIPYEKVMKYCEDKEIDLAWLFNIKKNNDNNS
jgi:hypothetical protein